MPQTYSQLYDRIQSELSVDDISAESVEAWLLQGKGIGPTTIKAGKTKSGKQRFTTGGVSAQGLSNIRKFARNAAKTEELYQRALDTINRTELTRIQREANTRDANGEPILHSDSIKEAIEIRRQEIELAEQAAEGI